MVVDFDDFALWIALHEQTHALQFHHAPWLATYMKDKAGELINGFPTESSLFDWVRAVASVLRGGPSVFDHVLDTAQRNTLSSVLAVMSVLKVTPTLSWTMCPTVIFPAREPFAAASTPAAML